MTVKEKLIEYKRLLSENREAAQKFRKSHDGDVRFSSYLNVLDNFLHAREARIQAIASEQDPIIRKALTESLALEITEEITDQ